MNIYDLLDITASICPEREGFVYKDKSLSFSELRDEVLTLSQSLINMGLKNGDRVFYFHTNTIHWITITLACARVGVVLVPINYRSNFEELIFMLKDSTPKVIFAGTRYHKLISSAINKINASITNVNIEGELTDGWINYKTLIVNSDVNEIEIKDSINNMALLVYTAGTTNTPKAVILNHSSFCEFALNNLNPADPEFKEVTLLSVPLYHVAGIQTLISGIYSGRTTVIQDQFDALDWMELVQKHKVNRVMVVPTMIKQIIDNQYFKNYDFNSLKIITYGAAPMPISVLIEAIKKFDNANFINAFGQTETAATITSLGPEDHKIEGTNEEKELKIKRLSSIGKPLPDVEVKIVNKNEQEVKPMTIGEIITKGERIMSGYWNNEEATNLVMKNGWLHTGDLGYIDLDGYIFLAGREKDFIKRGGEMISPEEIEQILYKHNSIDEVAVIGLPDDQWGEIVTAVIVIKSGVDINESDIIDYSKDKLSSYKRPEKIIFDNNLPRNSMGKILKKDLRKKYSNLF